MSGCRGGGVGGVGVGVSGCRCVGVGGVGLGGGGV